MGEVGIDLEEIIFSLRIGISNLGLKGSYSVEGELCGPAIQGNPLGLSENMLLVFSISNNRKRESLNALGLETALDMPRAKMMKPVITTKDIDDFEPGSYRNVLKGFYVKGWLNELVVDRDIYSYGSIGKTICICVDVQ